MKIMKKKTKELRRPQVPEGLDEVIEMAEIVAALKITRQYLRIMILTGKYPRPDMYIGRLPRWKSSTHNRWVSQQVRE